MSTVNIKLPRNLLTASAASILLASSAFAQGPGIDARPTVDRQQVPANSQLSERDLSGDDLSTGDGSVNTAEQAVAPDQQELTALDKEQMVINRSFDDEEELAEAKEIEAGSTAPVGAQNGQPLQQPLVKENDEQQLPESIRNVPNGTGAIAVDGEVIAKTTSEQADNQQQEEQLASNTEESPQTLTSSADQERRQTMSQDQAELAAGSSVEDATQTRQRADAPSQERASTTDRSQEQATVQRNEPAQSQQDQQRAAQQVQEITAQQQRADQSTAETAAQAQAINSLSNFENLKDTVIINTAGQEIGYIEALALNPDSGAVGLIIATRGLLGIRAQEVLAPVEEITISGDTVVWNTTKNKKELRQSERFNEDDYDRLTANTEDDARVGISQR